MINSRKSYWDSKFIMNPIIPKRPRVVQPPVINQLYSKLLLMIFWNTHFNCTILAIKPFILPWYTCLCAHVYVYLHVYMHIFICWILFDTAPTREAVSSTVPHSSSNIRLASYTMKYVHVPWRCFLLHNVHFSDILWYHIKFGDSYIQPSPLASICNILHFGMFDG